MIDNQREMGGDVKMPYVEGTAIGAVGVLSWLMVVSRPSQAVNGDQLLVPLRCQLER